MENPHIRAYFLAIVTTLLAVLVVYMFRPFLVTLGLAGIFSVTFTPLTNRLRRAGLSETLASLSTLLIATIVVAVPVSFLSVQLFHEAENVYITLSEPGSVSSVQAGITSLGYSLNGTFPGAGDYFANLSQNVGAYAQQGLRYALGNAGAFFAGTFSFLLQLFVFLMTLYYLLKERVRIIDAFKRFSPLTKPESEALTARLIRTITSVVRGTLVIALLQGALTAIGFALFGVPNSVLWGTVAVIGALIPSVGTALVFIPGVLYLFFIDQVGAAIGLGLFGVFVVGIADNILRPYLVGSKAAIHPLIVLLSVLGGLTFFGPGGLFLGPLVVSLLLGLLSIYTPSHNTEA